MCNVKSSSEYYRWMNDIGQGSDHNTLKDRWTCIVHRYVCLFFVAVIIIIIIIIIIIMPTHVVIIII